MGDPNVTERQQHRSPVSLNQIHSRVLHRLSSSSQFRPRQPLPPQVEEDTGPPVVKPRDRRHLRRNSSGDRDAEYDGVPQFSVIADFDSPSSVEMKPSKGQFEGRNILQEKNDDAVSASSGITDSHSHSSRTFQQGKMHSRNELQREGKPTKVKIEGRRRLCKISSKNENETTTEEKELKSPGVSDFDSPPPAINSNVRNCGDGNEIRDILNDLSCRLEILSIEKGRLPKTVDLTDSPAKDIDEGICQRKNEVVEEFSSATSSLSLNSNPSEPSSDMTADSRIEESFNVLDNTCTKSDCLQSKYEKESSVGRVNPINDIDSGKNDEAKRISSKQVAVVQEQDDADDSVVLCQKDYVQRVGSQPCQIGEGSSNPFDVDIDERMDASLSVGDSSVTLDGPKSTYRLRSKIAKMLYPHQRDGLKWLWSLHCQGKGGILGDDMGLGKTMQICGFLSGLFYSSLVKRVLIVAPKTLLPHWIKELSAVGLSEKTKEYFGNCAKAREYELRHVLQDKGILLTTYDIVRHNAKSLCGDFYFHDDENDDVFTWDYMILDEGHLIKNPTTQRAKSLLGIPCSHRVIISGTPIQNNLKELWALFNFCCPELLGDKKWFKDKYEYFILRGNEKNASDRDKLVGSRVAKDLRECIQPYFLRRLKSEVFPNDNSANIAKLSKKNEIIVWLKLTGCQRQLYEAFLNSELVLSAFDGSPLAALTILKKICDHPLLLTKRAAEDVLEGMDSMINKEDRGMVEKLAMHAADFAEDFVAEHNNISCKIYFIFSLLNDLIPKGHSVLIFSQTRKMLNLIQESLVRNGYDFLRIDGSTKASDRLKTVNEFQEGNGAPIFLLTSQVGGLGLTLTRADRVIVVDPAWNPSMDNQSVDRAYRIGQKKDVLVYRLMTCGTVEEKIYRKQVFKGGLFRTATEHKEQIRYFSQQDLRELFSLPKQGFDISLTQRQLHDEHDFQHKLDETLEGHLKFLETLGIAGVSHHSLLYSKTTTLPAVEEEEVIRTKGASSLRNSYTTHSNEPNVDGSFYAFNPKDVQRQQKNSTPVNELTEADISQRLNRLAQIFANKGSISRLPDKGQKIEKQIAALNQELAKMKMSKKSEEEVILLDDMSG